MASKKSAPVSNIWWLYIIEGANGQLYTGITTDLLRRYSEHQRGKGARYFRTTQPVAVVYVEVFPDRSTASRRENAIKALGRAQKMAVIKSGNGS